MATKVFFNNISADATSEEFLSNGGPATVNFRADNYGGGTVVIEQASKNDPNTPKRFLKLENGEFTADATVKLDYLSPNSIVRVVLSGSTGASNVFADISQ